MKKVILLLLTILSYSACTQAQIIETDSKMRTVIQEPEKPKSPRFTYFTAKVGGGALTDGDGGICPSANIELGVMCQLNDHGLYLGGEIGGTIIGISNKTENVDSFIFSIGPTLGIMKPIKENLNFDGHRGIGWRPAYWTAELGGGVWYKNYFAGIEIKENLDVDYNFNVFGVLLNLGIRF